MPTIDDLNELAALASYRDWASVPRDRQIEMLGIMAAFKRNALLDNIVDQLSSLDSTVWNKSL